MGKADCFHEEVIHPLMEGVGVTKHHYQVLATESSESVYNFAQQKLKDKACKGVKQTVILLSGDGGVTDVLNGLAGAERMRFVPASNFMPLFSRSPVLVHSSACTTSLYTLQIMPLTVFVAHMFAQLSSHSLSAPETPSFTPCISLRHTLHHRFTLVSSPYFPAPSIHYHTFKQISPPEPSSFPPRLIHNPKYLSAIQRYMVLS